MLHAFVVLLCVRVPAPFDYARSSVHAHVFRHLRSSFFFFLFPFFAMAGLHDGCLEPSDVFGCQAWSWSLRGRGFSMRGAECGRKRGHFAVPLRSVVAWLGVPLFAEGGSGLGPSEGPGSGTWGARVVAGVRASVFRLGLKGGPWPPLPAPKCRCSASPVASVLS